MPSRKFSNTLGAAFALIASLCLWNTSAQAQLWNGNYVSEPLGSPGYTTYISTTSSAFLMSMMDATPSVCPCRALISYYIPVTMASNLPTGSKIEAWVRDGSSNNYASSAVSYGVNQNGAIQGFDYSDVVYAPNQVLSFYLYAVANSARDVASYESGDGLISYFRIIFLPTD